MAGTTLDRWPQFVSGKSVALEGNDTDKVSYQEQPIPINRIAGMGNSIIEITSWELYITGMNASFKEGQYGAAIRSGSSSGLSVVDQVTLQLTDSHVLSFWEQQDRKTVLSSVAANNSSDQIVIRIPMQTVDGFGALVSTDKITVAFWMKAGSGITAQLFWRIYYRYVNVGLDEFIGLLQTQS